MEVLSSEELCQWMPLSSLNTAESIFSANELPAMLEKFLSTLGRYQAYEHVGGSKSGTLLHRRLYTKSPIRMLSYRLLIFLPVVDFPPSVTLLRLREVC